MRRSSLAAHFFFFFFLGFNGEIFVNAIQRHRGRGPLGAASSGIVCCSSATWRVIGPTR